MHFVVLDVTNLQWQSSERFATAVVKHYPIEKREPAATLQYHSDNQLTNSKKLFIL